MPIFSAVVALLFTIKETVLVVIPIYFIILLVNYKEIKKIINSINQLIENPRPINSKKLSASERYRLRVGDYRILYEIEDLILIVYIIKIAHRRDVYRA